MLYDRYEQNQLLFNMNFKEAVGDKAAYRGELVVVEGEVADAQGRRMAPKGVLAFIAGQSGPLTRTSSKSTPATCRAIRHSSPRLPAKSK